MNHEIDVLVTTKDRHSEIALMVQSLRTQTFQKWNLIILDDASGTPIQACGFLSMLLNQVKLEGHKVKHLRNEISYGVCAARNTLIDAQLNWNSSADLILRADDDVIFEPDYLERLIKVIDSGYDLASGIVPICGQPIPVRKIDKIMPIINEHKLDENGNLTQLNDDCGYKYTEAKVLPTHHFRTNCMYKKEVHEKVRHPTNLTPVGFREEGFFSMRAILLGYKIGVDTGAVAYHAVCQSGGCRYPNYGECVQTDEKTWRDWIKEKFIEHGDFIADYNGRTK